MPLQNDEATSLLMGGFYQGLSDRNKTLTKAEALDLLRNKIYNG